MSDDSRPKVLLLHGFLAAHQVWGPLLRQAEDEVDFVTPDLPGYGRSRRDEQSHNLDSVVDELLAVVESEQPTHVVGHSMGGIVALALAVRMPKQFRSVGLVGVPVFQDRNEALEFIGTRGAVRKTLMSRHGVCHFGCRVMNGTRLIWPPLIGPFSMTPQRILTSMFNHSRAAHSGGLDKIVFAGTVPGLAESVQTPVSVLHGARDRAAPEQPARELAERHGWPFETLDRARHQLIIDRPEYTWDWVQRTVLDTSRTTGLSSVAEPRTLVE